MGFELHQPWCKVEAVNEFIDQMKSALEEANSALSKAKDDMAWYYNRRRTPALMFTPGDKVYLDASDIQTTMAPGIKKIVPSSPWPLSDRKKDQNKCLLPTPAPLNETTSPAL